MQLKIKSQTEKLHLVRDFVSEAAREFGFDEETVSKIALAVDEACTNIIKHSYNYASNKDIEVKILTTNGTFEVVISHSGKSFDPAAIKAPDMREYLSHYRHGGLGMHLMRSLMDKIEYKKFSEEKSEVHLVKNMSSRLHR